MGISEGALVEIANLYGDGLTNESTDEEFINVVNRAESNAKIMQAEATRWTNAKKQADKKEDNSDDGKQQGSKQPEWFMDYQKSQEERYKNLENENKTFRENIANSERTTTINDIVKELGIPDWRMKGLSIPSELDKAGINTFLTEIKQDLITNKLVPAESVESQRVGAQEAVKQQGEALANQFSVDNN